MATPLKLEGHYLMFVHVSVGYDLGKLQTGETLNDVILPKWASSPEDFIRKHRQALVRTSLVYSVLCTLVLTGCGGVCSRNQSTSLRTSTSGLT